MSVLFGVFMYMGAAALRDSQLFDRIKLFITPMKYQPDYMYLRHVPLSRVHLFTATQVFLLLKYLHILHKTFQVACLALLWIIKSIKEISIMFPFMVNI
jgi:hypothetical protein